jgi:hypothetical protein
MNLFEDDKPFHAHKKKRVHRISYLTKTRIKRRQNKGWRYESNRHKLARKGIKTGRKESQIHFSTLFGSKAKPEKEIEKKPVEKEEPSETKEQVNYIYQWQDSKGNWHNTEHKPKFWQSRGEIKKVRFDEYMKDVEKGKKMKEKTSEQVSRLERENEGE